MHSDITGTIVAKAISKDWSRSETEEFYGDVMGAWEWDNEFCEFVHVERFAKYMLTQSDGLYGVSRTQIREWLAKVEVIA